VEKAVFEMLGKSGEAEVGNLEVTIGIEEEILWLEITVSDAVTVAETKCRNKLLKVETSGGFG
jgi:hypothetical protein